jgi:hypothetical protein
MLPRRSRRRTSAWVIRRSLIRSKKSPPRLDIVEATLKHVESYDEERMGHRDDGALASAPRCQPRV